MGIAWGLLVALGCGSSSREGESWVGGGQGGSNAGGGTSGSGPGAGGVPVLSQADAGGLFPMDDGGTGGSDTQYQEQNLVEMRIEPADAVLAVALGESKQLAYRAFGRFASDPSSEVELTERTVFYVPDNYLVASFPADGQGTLSTRLPSSASDAQQRGGSLTVRAQAANTDGSISTATTQLHVRVTGGVTPAAGSPEATPALPEHPDAQFVGTPAAGRAPRLVYPNDGVLLPPNLGRLEVHFQPGAIQNSLYQVEFQSASSTISHYARCYADSDDFEPGSCALTIAGADFETLASSNQGAGPVQLRVRGSDEQGTFGESDSIQIEFAEQRIDGAVYYWTTSNDTSIVRFDFGSGQSEPETFVSPDPESVPGNDGSCVGCHALSRQGDKAFFSLGNSDRGELMYVNDLSRSQSDDAFYAYNGAETDLPLPTAQRQNRVLTGSFNPDGSAFVAVAPVNDAADDRTLFFHDGTTGVRSGSVSLPFIPGQPDWSPSGDQIAVTAIGRNSATITFLNGGISLINQASGSWDGANPVTLVPAVAGKNRFNPAYLPDGSVLLYSEVDQGSYSAEHDNSCNEANVTSNGRFCNGYSDPGAKTWAVAPDAGATPVFLAKAAQRGEGDVLFAPPQAGISATDLMDTYPKPAPFMIEHRGKTLGWFTVGSQRRAGLRKYFPQDSVVGDPDSQALLWMFALDASVVAAGQDGSYPGFFLPFQNLRTSNHMAQWTQRFVSDTPPPAAPTPPPPAPPPAPPPPPTIVH